MIDDADNAKNIFAQDKTEKRVSETKISHSDNSMKTLAHA